MHLKPKLVFLDIMKVTLYSHIVFKVALRMIMLASFGFKMVIST